MKAIQVLTNESIEKIKRAIIFIEVINDNLPMDSAKERIKELNEILTEVNE